jgi:hypothetical protein
MSNPWLPPYLGSWEDLMAALLHDPYLGGWRRPNIVLQTHANTAAEPLSGWPAAVASLVGAVSLRDVASSLPDGRAKEELVMRVDQAISRFIDDCGTIYRHPLPWPPPGPVADGIASELAIIANVLPNGRARDGIIEVAGRIVQNAVESAPRRTPSDHEPDTTDFPSPESECTVLCRDYLLTIDELKHATGELRAQLQARLGLNDRRRRELKCKHCLPD